MVRPGRSATAEQPGHRTPTAHTRNAEALMDAWPYNSPVIVAASSRDLTVLETVKVELGIQASDTSRDAYLNTLITQASQIIATYCNRIFAQETLSDHF